MSLILRRPWTRQPQVAAPPVGSYLPDGVWIPAYGKTLWTPRGRLAATTATTTETVSAAGRAIKGDASSRVLNWVIPGVLSTSVLVQAAVFTVTSNGANKTAAGLGDNALVSGGLYAGVGQYTSGRISSWSRGGQASSDGPIDGPTAAAGLVYCVIRIDRSVTDHVMFVNGVRYSSVANTSNFPANYGNWSIQSCVRATTPIYASDDPVSLAWYANKDPGDSWAQDWSLNPWKLFAPLPRRIWVPAAAASGLPTLSLSTFVPGSLATTGWRPQVTTA